MCYRRVFKVQLVLCAAFILLVHVARVTAQETSDGRPIDQKAIREELTRLLSKLAASAERTTMGGRMGSVGENLPDVNNVCRAARLLLILPAGERYQMLKDWVLLSGPGAMMRTARCYAPVEMPPEFFFSSVKLPGVHSSVARDGKSCPGSDGVVCFVEMLVGAASETGKLEELATAAEEAAKKSDMADTLLTLDSFARNRDRDLDRQVDKVIAEWQKEAKAAGQGGLRPWPAYMAARAWMRSRTYRDKGARLAELLTDYARETHQQALLGHVLRDRAVCRVTGCGGTLAAIDGPELVLWHPTGCYFGQGSQMGTWPSWWVEHKGVIAHLSGPEVSTLYFDYPLAGTFELTVDGQCDVSGDAAVQYGRMLFEPSSSNKKTRFSALDRQTTVERPNRSDVQGRCNQLTIRVRPDKVSYLCNGDLVLEDSSPSPTTPWLGLVGCATRATTWRNLRFVGKPQIPREVHLIQGDRMEGWMSPLYQERLPVPFAEDSDDSITSAPVPALQDCDWVTSAGTLFGGSNGSTTDGPAYQSWLAYHRPLRNGETLSYDFFFQPKQAMVYPCLGRIAMLFEPDGVRLHWITDIPHVAIGGLRPDNAAIVVDEQRGPRPVPLKPNGWNATTIKMASDRATVHLNGVEVYCRWLGATDSRMFGLFYYRSRTVAKVRNVVLTGKWPESLSEDQMSQITARNKTKESPENVRSRAALADESRMKSRGESE
jgi:hypothetical protein